jgi:peroxiredoxin
LADYQAHIDQFNKENVDIIALSVDPLDKAKEMAERVKATFAIGYGLKVPEDADKVGAYWEDRRQIIHATNFIIDADKKVTQACFATGPSAASSRKMLCAPYKEPRKGRLREVNNRRRQLRRLHGRPAHNPLG